MGSSFGVLTMVDTSWEMDDHDDATSSRSSSSSSTTTRTNTTTMHDDTYPNTTVPGYPLRWQCPGIVKKFQSFDKLTSVHGNCNDGYMLVSGYSHGVRIYDLNTGACVADPSDIHTDHINISRFANHR